MADVTISDLPPATPSSNGVLAFSDGSTTSKVNANSIVGLTTNGTFRGTVQRGSYGSLSIGGSNNGWSGIDFTDTSSTLMVRNSDGLTGIYRNNNTWAWYFDGNGVLTVGSVPWGLVTGKPSIPSTTTTAKAWVNFDGSGNIRSSYNVSSVTSNAAGDFNVNFTSSMADANYCSVGACGNRSRESSGRLIEFQVPTATSVRAILVQSTTGSTVNYNNNSVAIFG